MRHGPQEMNFPGRPGRQEMSLMPGKGSAARHEHGAQAECERTAQINRKIMRRDTVMAKLSRAEITAKTIEIIHNCVPELQGVELTEASVVNTDMSMDSMSFIMVICKLEAEFNVKIPNRQWNKLKTLGQVVDAIEKYQK